MDKLELNQNGQTDETGKDEILDSLPDETPKIQKKRRPKKKRPPSAEFTTSAMRATAPACVP